MDIWLELWIPIILIIVVISGISLFLYWLVFHKAKQSTRICLGGLLLIVLGVGSPFLFSEWVIAGTNIPYSYVGILGGLGGGFLMFFDGIRLRKKEKNE